MLLRHGVTRCPSELRQCDSNRRRCTRSETKPTCTAQLQQSLSAYHHFQPCSITQTLTIKPPVNKSLYFSIAWSIHLSLALSLDSVSPGETFCRAFLSPPRSLLPLINYVQMSFIGIPSMAINNCVPLAGAVKLIGMWWKAIEMLCTKSWFITHCTAYSRLIAQRRALLSLISIVGRNQ